MKINNTIYDNYRIDIFGRVYSLVDKTFVKEVASKPGNVDIRAKSGKHIRSTIKYATIESFYQTDKELWKNSIYADLIQERIDYENMLKLPKHFLVEVPQLNAIVDLKHNCIFTTNLKRRRVLVSNIKATVVSAIMKHITNLTSETAADLYAAISKFDSMPELGLGSRNYKLAIDALEERVKKSMKTSITTSIPAPIEVKASSAMTETATTGTALSDQMKGVFAAIDTLLINQKIDVTKALPIKRQLIDLISQETFNNLL